MAIHPSRKSIRLRGYDYTQAGGYFVTICANLNLPKFGEIVDGKMIFNEIGMIVDAEWQRTQILRKEITLDEFIIMPDHLHGIIIIDYTLIPKNDNNLVGAHGRAPLQRTSGSLGSIIAGFKSSSTKEINQIKMTPGAPVWQRGYYDRIIRDEKELDRVREYIRNNPANNGNEELLF